MSDPIVVWHEQAVKRADRERLNGHRGCVVWFTGLSGCGKSTVANAVDHQLHAARRAQLRARRRQRAPRAQRHAANAGGEIRRGLRPAVRARVRPAGPRREHPPRRRRGGAAVRRGAGDADGVRQPVSRRSRRGAGEPGAGRLHRGRSSTRRWRYANRATPRGCTKRPAPASSRISRASTRRTSRPRGRRLCSSRRSTRQGSWPNRFYKFFTQPT